MRRVANRRGPGTAACTALTLALAGAGCRNEDGGATKSGAQPAAVPSSAAAGPEPARPSRSGAERIDGREYWRARALQRIEQETERESPEGPGLELELKDPTGSAFVLRQEIMDPRARDRGYRDAVEILVGRLREPEPAVRAATVKQLSALVRTERGDAQDWAKWFDEVGDYLVWNEDKLRVEVDENRRAAGVAETVDGLRLSASVPKDRFKVGEPIELTVKLQNTGPAGDPSSAVEVDQRLVVGADLVLEVHRRSPTEDDALAQRPAATPAGSASLTPLAGGDHVETTFDLLTRLADPPGSGTYSIRVRHPPTQGTATPDLASLTLHVRIVPW